MAVDEGASGPLDEEVQKIIADLEQKSKDPDRKALYEQWKAEQRESQIAALMKQAGIPRMYQGKSFDNFTVTKENLHAVDCCKRYVLRWEISPPVVGIALFGDIGAGKSHLAVAVMRELITRYLIPARYATVIHTFERARWSFDSEGINPIPRLLYVPFLVLDDLGSERPTVWTLEQVSHIIDYRLTEGLPIMITSNAANWSGLIKMLTLEVRGDRESRAHIAVPVARIVDRLREAVGDPVVIKGKSWRGRQV